MKPRPIMKQCPISLSCLFLLSALLGCGSSEPIVGKIDKTRWKLQAISGAYLAATTKAGQVPQNPEDLFDFFGEESTSEEKSREKFRSDNDGEEFVIIWGVDLRKTGTSDLPRDAIFAYEERGKGGQRYVLKPPADVLIVPEDVFQKSQFPNGHKPGS